MGKVVIKFNAKVEVIDNEITHESFAEHLNGEEGKKNVEEFKEEMQKLIANDEDNVFVKVSNIKFSFEE